MNVVSLFSGLGGLDKGFADTGYNIVWANDFDKYAVQTYKFDSRHQLFLIPDYISGIFLWHKLIYSHR